LIIAFVFAYVGVLLVYKLALKKSWLSMPKEDRWHQKPTALFGGLGFIPVFIFLQLYLIVTSSDLLLDVQVALIIGVISMFILGWFDDVKPVGPFIKLFIQIIVSGLIIHNGVLLEITSFEIINITITYIWFVVIINALNMLDNMDGLAAGVAVLISIFLILLSYSSQSIGLMLGGGFFVIVFAFLLFNSHPASIFMGDSGSLPIGYILATLTIASPINASFGIANVDSYIYYLITLSLLLVPLFDFTFVFTTRILRGRRPYVGGKDHSSHMLVLCSLSEKQAVIVLYILTITGGVIAVGLKYFAYEAMVLLIMYILFLLSLGWYLGLKVVKTSS